MKNLQCYMALPLTWWEWSSYQESQKPEMSIFFCSNGGIPTQLPDIYDLNKRSVTSFQNQLFFSSVIIKRKKLYCDLSTWNISFYLFQAVDYRRESQTTHSGSHGHQWVISWLVSLSSFQENNGSSLSFAEAPNSDTEQILRKAVVTIT